MRPDLAPPPRVGRYRLGRLLGQGASGQVYAATHPRPSGGSRQVALKLQQTASGLLREARMASNLRHRNIVDVYEVGEDADWSFCAMELCGGGSLSTAGPLSPRAVVEVGLQVCAALTYAHEALELVHLDIKPQNLLLDGATVKLADLGIATARGFAEGWAPAGTPQFMPPEQRMGGTLDTRSDLFALGQTLRALLGGDAVGGASETLDWGSFDLPTGPTDPLVPPRQAATGVDGVSYTLLPLDTLEGVLDKATAPEPEDRWPSAAAMAHALRQVAAAGPGLAEILGVTPQATVAPVGMPPAVRRLVGRDVEVAEALAALHDGQLVTLRGGAGVGKTALAAVALRLWPGEASFVDLSTARSDADLLVAVAEVLDVSLEPSRTEAWAAQLGRSMATRSGLLLVLDGFEGLHAHRERLLGWLGQAPELRLLVTSRIVLGLPEERVVGVGPLAADAALTLLQHHAADRGVVVEDDDVARRLVAQLDGLPLAIALAAGRLGVLSLAEVEARLAPAFLRASEAGRHETLDRALAWSWDLLDPPARSALAAVSVFDGASSRADLLAVLSALSLDGVAALRVLAAHSLVQITGGDEVRLYRQVRAYAAARLTDLGLGRAARDAHAARFARLGTPTGIQRLRGPERLPTLAVLRQGLPNLLVAMAHAVETGQAELAGALWSAAQHPLEQSGQCGRAEADGRVISNLLPDGHALARHIDVERVRLLGVLGRLTEASALATRFLSRHGDAVSPELMIEQALLEQARGNFPASLGLLERSVSLLEFAGGSKWKQAHGHNSLGNALVMLGRLGDAHPHHEEALQISEDLGDLHTLATVLGNMGNRLRQQGRWREAATTYARSLRLHREDGATRLCGHILGNMAYLYRLQGQLADALEAYGQALDVARFHGDRSSECIQLINRSIALIDLDRLTDAAADLDAALVLADQAGLAAVAAYARLQLGKVSLRGGALEEADAVLRQGLSALQNIGAPLLLAEGLAIQAELRLAAGDGAAAQATLDRARALTPPEERESQAIVDAVQARIDAAGGAPVDA